MASIISMRPRQKEPPAPLGQYGDVLTVAEVSKELGISQKVVREYCAAGKLPAVKIGPLWRIPKQKLIEALGLGAA